MHKDINVIVAVDNQGGFGKNGKIPWHYKEDFKHFQNTTKGHVCVMGRKTYEDMAQMAKQNKRKIKKSILPDRKCYVLSDTKKKFKGAEHANGLREVAQNHPNEKIFVLGGAKLFQRAMVWANTLHMTVIDTDADCDVFFPVNTLKSFSLTEGEKITVDDIDLMFMKWERN